jgi:hypothetical protein
MHILSMLQLYSFSEKQFSQNVLEGGGGLYEFSTSYFPWAKFLMLLKSGNSDPQFHPIHSKLRRSLTLFESYFVGWI